MSDVEDVAARIAASDEKFCGSEVDLAIELEFSFSIVCFVKYGEENPCFRRQRKAPNIPGGLTCGDSDSS